MNQQNSFVSTASAALLGLALTTTAIAQQSDFLQDEVLGKESWRSIGPSNFSGRVVDIAVDPEDRFTWYVVTGTGGLWKTTNNGTTFDQIFDEPNVFSLGDMAIAPSNPEILYLGTGEANNQRSSYFGNGLWKSTDKGETWEHIGLEGTDHIGRVVVHPTNPDIVYVAALGALYKPNEERGLYRTMDGGDSWNCVKWINQDTGFVDVAIDPKNPDILIAASYDRRRRAWDFRDGGPGSALWRSTDAGNTWRKCGDIPDGHIGRIGVAIHPTDDVAYAIVENRNPRSARPDPQGIGERGQDQDEAPQASVDPEMYHWGEAEEDSAPGAFAPPMTGGEIYRSTDSGKSWERVNDRPTGGTPHYYYGQIRIDPNDSDHLWCVGVRMYESTDGGQTWKSGFARGLHVDHHALWIDPSDSKRCLLGNDGGIALTNDGGKHWHAFDNLSIAQFYTVSVDMREPYNVYGGTQDNGSWAIPSRQLTNRPIGNRHAVKVGGGDGFYVVVDPNDPNLLYSESQFGALRRVDLSTGGSRSIRPRGRRGDPRLRFNWMSPLVLSPHDERTIYFGSQYLHRSRDRGDSWETISPDLTTADPDKLKGDVPHCTITTIAASPLRNGLLVVGTDDGEVWMTRNDGDDWTRLTDRIEGVPENLWVSRVEVSSEDPDRMYVAFTGYREDLRDPFLFLSTDGGTTFRSIVNDLPKGESINVVKEHPRNGDCVLVGTEFGAYASIDGGGSWYRLGKDLPTCAVHDLVVHPRDHDVVIGTHGRGFYVLDATLLEDLNSETVSKSFHVLPARDAVAGGREFQTVRYPAAAGWTADRAPTQAIFRYWLTADTEDTVEIEVFDISGNRVFNTEGSRSAGLHRVLWQNRGRGRRGGGSPSAGTYRVRISVGGDSEEQIFQVRRLPGAAEAGSLTEEEESGDDEENRSWIW